MTSVSTDTTDDVGGEVLLLGAVVLAVADLATVLTSLILVITKGTVQGSKLTKLVTLQLVLAFRNRGSLYTGVSIGALIKNMMCRNVRSQ